MESQDREQVLLQIDKDKEDQDHSGESGNLENNQGGGGDVHEALLSGEQGLRRRSKPQEDGVVDGCRARDFRLKRLLPPRVFLLLLCLVLYILFWVLVYTYIDTKQEKDESHNQFIEALYFILVTIFTVEFGDVKPNNNGTKWVSVILILVGVGFVDFGSNMVMDWMITKLEILVLGGKLVLTVKGKALCFILVLVVCICVTTIGTLCTESLSITDAVYLSTASLTTLRYGDLKFQTDHAMLFCVLWLPLGILILSKALLCLAHLGFSWCKVGVGETTLLFTSQSVTQGHPDKICDVLVDAIVDVCLEKDPKSRVLCEACVDARTVAIFGKAKMKEEELVNLQEIINTEIGCPDQYVIENKIEFIQEFEASYQGSVFGYATDESKLALELTQAINKCSIPWLKPSGKVEVTVEYRDDNGAMVPLRVHCIFITTEQHELVRNDEVRQALMTHLIEPVMGYCRFEL